MASLKKDKKMYFEVLRIICIFFVMFNHTAPSGFLAFKDESNVFLYALYLFCSVLCKIAVPVFFMISGALLLGKTEPIGVLLKKRVLTMAVVLLLISIPNFFWLNEGGEHGIAGFFRKIYTGTATTALWYLYTYIGFLLMLPLLRAMVKRMKEKEFVYLFWLHLLIVVLLTVGDNFLFTEGHNRYMSIAVILESNIFYPLMGYYVEHVMDRSRFTKKNYGFAAILFLTAIIVTCIVSQMYYSFSSPQKNADYEACFDMLICIPAICLFFIAKGTVTMKNDSRIGRVTAQVGGAVFGLYLIENVCRMLAAPVYKLLVPYTGGFVASIAMVLAGMIIGLSAVCLLKNIPGLKRVINYFI